VDEAADYVSTLPGKRMAAGVLLFDGSGRVLLVEPTYKRGWEFPGGAVMADESPWSAAVREVKEELGLVLTGSPRLLVTDWVPPRERRTECVVWLFDGGPLGAAEVATIRLPAEELRSFRFAAEQEAAELLPPIRARRLRAALAVRAEGSRPGYLEDGRPPR
jgi:8-oxo-dGTP diphosphatase